MTKPTVYLAPLTISEALWLAAAASREQARLVKWNRRHTLADSVIPKLDASIDEAIVDTRQPTESVVMAKADYAALSQVHRTEVDGRWAATPEHVKDRIRDEAELDLL